METELNLRPYGEVPPARRTGPLWVYDDPALATSRAAYKLRQWLDGGARDKPIGAAVWWPGLVATCGLAELAFGAAFWWNFGTPGPMLLTGPLGIFLLLYAARTITRSRARNPLDCMREFVHCIQRADLSRAYRLVSPLDRDNYTRATPSARELDPLSVKRFAFDSPAGFFSYWRAARSLGPATRLRLLATGHVQMLRPDAALVGVEVHLQQSMRLQTERKALSLHKLVLRHGPEWRVFDGEVAGHPDLDNQWLTAALSGQPA